MTPPLDRHPESPGPPGAFFCLSDIGGHRTRRQAAALVSWSRRALTPRVVASPGRRFESPAVGALRALSDLCRGIVSERLEGETL